MQKITDFLLSKQFFLPIIYVIAGLITYTIISKIINKLNKIPNKKANINKQKTIISLFKNIVKVAIIIIVLLLILSVYGIDTSGIIASLSVIGVVVGLAFQDVLKNLFAGILIIFDDRFAVGDFVSINNFKGEVILLGLQTTKIKAETGEVFIIGNSAITNLINYSQNNSKLIIDLTLNKEINLEKMEKIIKDLKTKIENIENVSGEVEILGVEEFVNGKIKYRMTVDSLPLNSQKVKREILKMLKKQIEKNNLSLKEEEIEISIK